MNPTFFALGAVFAAVSTIFFARSGKGAEPAKARGARLVGGLFLAAGLLCMAAGFITMFKNDA